MRSPRESTQLSILVAATVLATAALVALPDLIGGTGEEPMPPVDLTRPIGGERGHARLGGPDAKSREREHSPGRRGDRPTSSADGPTRRHSTVARRGPRAPTPLAPSPGSSTPVTPSGGGGGGNVGTGDGEVEDDQPVGGSPAPPPPAPPPTDDDADDDVPEPDDQDDDD